MSGVEYTFDIPSIIIGLVIIAIGAVIVKYYNKIADTTGFGNYSRWQLTGFVTIGIGFLIMLSVHLFILKLLVNTIMGGGL